jgi:hypothetical protein
VLKSAFLGCVEVAGHLVPRDSRTLSRGEFADYCDEIEGHYAAEGVEFPEEW